MSFFPVIQANLHFVTTDQLSLCCTWTKPVKTHYISRGLNMNISFSASVTLHSYDNSPHRGKKKQKKNFPSSPLRKSTQIQMRAYLLFCWHPFSLSLPPSNISLIHDPCLTLFFSPPCSSLFLSPSFCHCSQMRLNLPARLVRGID